ncbi:helicase MOM1-like isoform X1 [Olea europaea subsp. europaea]|uniref:Helicase MOM1-like isoform X1 n=1 Tax=Olea europaea subsp. europaea TaxID=158383 RepID=A0A8S0V5J1_OLEEU|nr:helicase MOM1-like isoform X1 [Olea europaea subsp. europaea]
MVSSTRSAKKNTDEFVGNSSKKKMVNKEQQSNLTTEKADVLGLRRSTRETQSSRLKTPSPQSTRKSERIERQTPPLIRPVKRKSDRIEKHNLTSTPRKSDRCKKINLPSSSGSKQSGKRLSPLNLKKKEIKEKSLKQLTVESRKAEPDLNSVGTKRKKMDACSYKALFKPQKIKYSMPDVAEELPRQDKPPAVISGGISSEPIGKSGESSGRVIQNLANESSGTASGVDVLENDIDGKLSQSFPAHSGNDEPSQPPDGDGLKNVEIGCTIIDILDDEERAPCSSIKNVEVTDLRSADGSEDDVQCIQPKGSVPSSGREVHHLLGTCFVCFRKKRLDYDSPEEELCSCGASSNVYLNDFPKDRGDQEAAIYSESTGRCSSGEQNETHSDHRRGGPKNVCLICNQGGELLCCIGNRCKRCYHPLCLDPPLSDVPPGMWHCLWCVKKKVELGAHSVSQGVESIWNAREVEVPNAEGVQRQKQYLVKYHGLAHVHNHWVPEKRLLPENYYLIAEFNSKHQVVRWNAEWTVPQRLLKKRSIIFPRQQNKLQITPSIDISDCQYEWLVKWHGLNYEHASWELDNSSTLSSPQGQNLMKDYEIRLQKAKRTVDKSQKGSYFELLELPVGGSLPNSCNLLKHVNKLRQCWYNNQNAVVFDNQEWAMTVIFFVLSLTEVCQPFLMIVASDAISQWEAEFTRLAPSIAVTVYSGSKDMRRGIRTFEFYEEGGCMMLHVLLSSPEAVFEDLDILRCIRWEAVIIDECQHSGIENHWGQIKMLPTDSRILLFNGQIKDTVSEYLNLLSLLDSHDDLHKFRGFKSDTIDNLGKLKERLSHFIAYGSIPELSKFVEYWVPVPMSNCQLEQYCATLLSNSIPLRCCSKSDSIGALRDILFTVRKCCDHPYLVDSSVQEGLIAEGRANELLDTGIKACGKLQLLDIILSEIKNKGQQVLILFQTVVGLGGASIGDILDDFMRQRFGPNSYERIDAGVAPSKKHATVNRFNKKETGQFVFLLGNRARSSSIKLSSVDIVIIYDSEWNPANDLRALQKISFDSKFEQIKVFRLYSSCTVEEKALLLAKQVVNLDNNLQNLSRTTSDTLLMWGASYLFSKLDDYHAESSPTSVSNISSEQLLLNDTTKELLAILSGSCDSGSIISKVQLGVGHYSINLPLLGEGKIQLKDGEEAHVFWRNLLEGRNPRWKHSCGSTPRNRKRVQYFDVINRNPDTESDEVGKKRRKVANENVNPASIQVELKGHQMNLADGSNGGLSKAIATNKSLSLEESTSCRIDNVSPESNPNFMCGQSFFDPGVHADKPQETVTPSNEQKNLHILLKGEMERLCQILKVSGDVMHMVERFLEYVIKNHHVSNESPTVIQAFQISLCWIAASILKQKIDKKDSLMIAKQYLNYGCTEEQATHVYSKMRLLKKMFLQCSENKESRKDCLLSTEDISKESCKADAGIPQYSAVNLQNAKSDIERSANKEPSGYLIVSEHKNPMNDKVAESETEEKLKKIQKKCDKRLKILIQKQQDEVKKFHRIWEEKREQLEIEHKLESACIRSIHGQGSVAIDKLQILDSDFAKKMEEFKRLKDMHVKDLEANQLSARSYERQKAASWLAKAKAKACHIELIVVDEPVGSQSEDKVGCSEAHAHITIRAPENAAPISKKHTEDTNPNEDVHLVQGNVVAPSNTFVIAHAEAVGSTLPTETANHLSSITSERELGTSSFERTLIAELPCELIHSGNTTGEMASGNLPGSGELVSVEIPMVQVSEEIPTEVPATVSEDVIRVHPVEHIDVSDKCVKGDIIDSNLSDDVNQRDGNESISGYQSLVEQSLLPPTGTIIAPSDGSLPPSHALLESSTSGEFRDEDAPVSENESALQVEVAISKHIDSENPAPSNDHVPEYRSTLQVEDGISDCIDSEPPTESNQALVTENHERLQPVSIDVSLRCDQTPATGVEHENHDRERILIPETSPQLSGELESLPYQTASQNGQDLVEHPPVALMGSTLDCHHLDLGLVNQIDHVPNSELFAFSQSNASMPQAVVNTAELPNQVILQSEVDLYHARGSGNLTSQPTYQVPTWYPTSSLHAEPLQNELLRISKETEKAVKVHEDLKLLLKSECEKEIQEVIAQIHNKYEAKLHDAETAFQLKKNELDKNHNKVLMNRILAEAFRSKCLDLRPSGPPGMQRAMSSSFMQQLSMQRPVRHPVSSVSQPQTVVPTVQTSQQLPLPNSTVPSPVFGSSSRSQPRIVTPTVQAAHQPSLPHSAGPPPGFVSSSNCQPVASQHNPTPAVQTVRRASARLSGLLTRPPLISAITPSTGNLRVGEVRSPAPHLQPFRPSTSASAASLPLHSHAMPSQQSPTPRPATSPFSQHTPQQTSHSQVLPLPTINPISRNRPQHESRLSAPHNSSQSAVQLLMDMDQRPLVHGHNTFATLPDVGTNFGSLEQSNLETLGNVQGTLPSSVATEDVVYLSDED